jgi:hypothetical protein
MPRTTIPTTIIVRAGVTQPAATYSDITNNHSIASNDGRILLELINASNASDVDVTFDVPRLYDDDLTISDLIVTLAPGSVIYSGPFKRSVFNQTDNSVHINVESTGISFRSYQLSS